MEAWSNTKHRIRIRTTEPIVREKEIGPVHNAEIEEFLDARVGSLMQDG